MMATHYNYYRDYDPSVGRYIQSDPIGLIGGTNTFGYANPPISQVDSLGLSPAIIVLNPAFPRPTYGLPFPGSCGVSFKFPNFVNGRSFQDACNAHDRCYEKPCAVKDECDRAFLRDMYSSCAGNTGCVIAATAYFLAVNRFGHNAFNDSQASKR